VRDPGSFAHAAMSPSSVVRQMHQIRTLFWKRIAVPVNSPDGSAMDSDELLELHIRDLVPTVPVQPHRQPIYNPNTIGG
jgi:hypothetical protein